MEKYMLNRKTNIISMKSYDNGLLVNVIHENENSIQIYQIDTVSIDLKHLKKENSEIIIDQLISNDLKNVGYRYCENTCDINEIEHKKTMYSLQVRGTIELLINEAERKCKT